MLYTVVPLENIYKEVENKNKESIEMPLTHGHVDVRKNGESYIVERVISTDMKDYLNNKYMPGSIFEIK